MSETYLVRFSGGAYKVTDGSTVSGEIVLEAVETPSGVYFYAVPRNRVVHNPDDGMPITKGVPLARGKDLPETGVEVLMKRNEELRKENAVLRARDEVLTKQNEQLMERLLSYADIAMERLNGQREDSRIGGERAPSKKASRPRRRARDDEGPEEEGGS